MSATEKIRKSMDEGACKQDEEGGAWETQLSVGLLNSARVMTPWFLR